MFIIDKVSFEEIDLEYSKRGIETSSKVISLIKDILEDNSKARISYCGLSLKFEGEELKVEEDGSKGFAILSQLNEADKDNLKIHGFKLNQFDSDTGLFIEESQIIDSSIEYFKTTNIF